MTMKVVWLLRAYRGFYLPEMFAWLESLRPMPTVTEEHLVRARQEPRGESPIYTGEVARRLKVSNRWIRRRWIAYMNGDPNGLPGYRDSPDWPVRFYWSEIDAWIRRPNPQVRESSSGPEAS